MNVLFGSLILCMLFLALIIWYRINWAHKKRMRLMDTDWDKYMTLQSYDMMIVKFWVWDIDKFVIKK